MFITSVSFSQNTFNASSKNRFSADNKPDKITLPGGITITVVETRGDKVKLGIEAPKDAPVEKPDDTKPTIHTAKSRFKFPGSSSNN